MPKAARAAAFLAVWMVIPGGGAGGPDSPGGPSGLGGSVAAGCPAAGGPAGAPESLSASPTPAEVSGSHREVAPSPDEARLLSLINEERRTRRLAEMSWDSHLARLARLHAKDMRDAGRLSHHSTSDGADFTSRLSRTPYRARAAAENVALDEDVVSAHRGLMRSPGHRRNILSPDLTAVGIAIVAGAGGSLYIVEDFAAPLADLDDREALTHLRAALARARRRGDGPPLEENRSVSRSMEGLLEEMVAADSVGGGAGRGFASGWVFTYTSTDPSDLPAEVSSHVTRARAYALAAAFRKTRSYPFGTWWVALALERSP